MRKSTLFVVLGLLFFLSNAIGQIPDPVGSPTPEMETVCPDSPCPCGAGYSEIQLYYFGEDDVTVEVFRDAGLNDLIGSFSGVLSGDLLVVDASTTTAGRFSNYTYIRTTYKSRQVCVTSFYSNCPRLVWPNSEVELVTLGQNFGDFTVYAVTDVENAFECTIKNINQDWHVGGNIVESDNNTLGTLNEEDVKLITNNMERGVITKAGDFGLGTLAPTAKLDVAGTTKIDETLDVFGITTVRNVTSSTNAGNGALVVVGGAGIRENLNVGIDATIGNDLTVARDGSINRNLDVGQNAKVGNDLEVVNNASVGVDATIGNDLLVGRDGSFGRDLSVVNDAFVGNDLDVTNNAAVGVDATVGNDLSVGRDGSFGRNLAVTNNASVGNDLMVTNNASIGIDAKVGNDLMVIRDGSFGRNLAVDQNASVGDDLFVGNEASIGGDAFVGNDLAVSRDGDFGRNVGINQNLTVGGNTLLGGLATVNGFFRVNDNALIDGNLRVTGVGRFETSVRIGPAATPVGYRLSVDGRVICEELRVRLSGSWPDYVFEDTYRLKTLAEVERHIKTQGHLPNIPAAKEVETSGLSVGEMTRNQQEKIEEIFLYLIQMNKELKAVQAENISLKKQIQILEQADNQ